MATHSSILWKFCGQRNLVGYIVHGFAKSRTWLSDWAYCSVDKAMTTHASTLAWKIPWMEEPGRLQSMGSLRVGQDRTQQLHFHFSLSCTGEGNGNPLQCSCLENPTDGEAWWAAIYGVTQSRTRLKQLSSSSVLLNRNFKYLWIRKKKLYSFPKDVGKRKTTV